MKIIKQQGEQTLCLEQSITSSTHQVAQPASYPAWLDELFMRFAVIYQGRWTFAIQDPRMLELTKFEWWETLKDFDKEIIMETVTDVKKIPGDFPSIQKFYQIASSKQKARQDAINFERKRKEDETLKKLPYTGNSEAALEAKEAIRKLCRIKSANQNGNPSRSGQLSTFNNNITIDANNIIKP